MKGCIGCGGGDCCKGDGVGDREGASKGGGAGGGNESSGAACSHHFKSGGGGFGVGRGKAQPSVGERIEIEIDVNDRDMGRLIGKGGSSIRDLQDGSGCRIVTPEKKGEGDDPSMRKVKILGTKELDERCKEAIDAVLFGEEPRDAFARLDGAVLMKNVDPICIGHLAKTKKDLERNHNVTIELGARSLRIWSNTGDRDSAEEAKEKIDDSLQDLVTMDSVTVSVPGALVNRVINDSALRQLQDQTCLTANVMRNDDGSAIRLTGLAGAINEAKAIIEKRACGEGAEFLPLVPGLMSRMPARAWGELQHDISIMMNHTRATVELAQESTRASIIGLPESVRLAKCEMQKIMHYYFPRECETIDLPRESVDWIAGEDDRELLRLQSASATAALDRSSAQMWICGDSRAVEHIRNRIRNSLARWDKEHCFMRMQSRHQCIAVIGSGGSTIRELQSSTAARIDVDTNACTIRISGTEDRVKEAKRRVQEITRKAVDWRDWEQDSGRKGGRTGSCGGKGLRDIGSGGPGDDGGSRNYGDSACDCGGRSERGCGGGFRQGGRGGGRGGGGRGDGGSGVGDDGGSGGIRGRRVSAREDGALQPESSSSVSGRNTEVGAGFVESPSLGRTTGSAHRAPTTVRGRGAIRW
eukprot:TRINITY_DN15044_c0_g2_i1.p1 TRINITY_DN15044_c0_g2~~TRINITY_DN15044_c0_g2_i1.p1  ORF type:complete len:642 (+),score=121.10 TRINITY_DN15044_c0_g2_i1:195-2120(+)